MLAESAFYKWMAGGLAAALLGLLSFLGGQLSMKDDLDQIMRELVELRVQVLVVQTQLDGLTQRFEDARDTQ